MIGPPREAQSARYPGPMGLRDAIRDVVDVITPDLIELRREIHAHPELSWNEERTTDLVATWLEKASIPYTRLEGTGLYADLGPSEGALVALRADLDALPVAETSTDPWRSRVPDVAHACGHDVHTVGLIGAAMALAETERRHGLPHGVRLIFQPAEETMPGGALKMLESGALSGVSRIFALHCDPSLDVGQIGLREGPITGASDFIHITLTGRGGHTSRPHLTEDLTFALGGLITQLPAALTRRFDPRSGVSLVWGYVRSGNAPNVIPESGEVGGTLRMLDAQAWHEAEHLVRGLIHDVTEPYGVGVDISYVRGMPPVVNEFEANETLRDAVVDMIGPQAVASTPQSLGGEDFAWYLESIPGAMGRLGTRTPGGLTYDLHQGNFRVDERAIALAAKVLAATAIR